MQFNFRFAGTVISQKQAMTFTIAVEKVIEKHCPKRAENLCNDYRELKSTSMKFRDYYLGRLES